MDVQELMRLVRDGASDREITTLVGYVMLLVFGRTLAGLVAGIVLVDIGVQAGHVANQSRIYTLAPTARFRESWV